MSDKIQSRLEEVMSLLPCPVSGCWGLHGAETSLLPTTRTANVTSWKSGPWPSKNRSSPRRMVTRGRNLTSFTSWPSSTSRA